ncbi:hypothetical protein F5888DRAFT_739430 [Russula emetica]|nr:hypothetical protein F5888DRAFT_739430 [Russula emetica]
MSFGLFRQGFHERSAFGLGRLLWKQGLIWLLVATIAEVLPAVFICLNLNGSIQLHVPASLDGHLVNCCDSNLSRSDRLCPRRVYRTVRHNTFSFFSALTAHCGRYGRPSDPTSLQGSGRNEWKGNTPPVKLAPLSRMEVAINRTYEQDQTLQTSQYGSSICVEGQSCEKPTRQPQV